MVDLVVLACVLRATTKKGRKRFAFPQIFSYRTAPVLHVLLGSVFHVCVDLTRLTDEMQTRAITTLRTLSLTSFVFFSYN